MFASIDLFSYEIRTYDLLIVVGGIVFLLFTVVQTCEKETLGIYSSFLVENCSKHFKFPCVLYESLFLSLFLYALPGVLFGRSFSSLFRDFTGGTNAVMYFNQLILLFPISFIVAFLLGKKVCQQLDMVTPAFPLALTYAKLACFCGGCCRGFQTPYGFYNYQKGLREFPVQLVESAEALVIFLILMKIRKKAKLGTMFPIYLMLYSGSRFFSEFLRRELNVFGYIKFAQIFCIVFFLLGLFGFYFTKRYGIIIDAAFASFYSKIEGNLLKKFHNKSSD